jgi:uncharacterized membrane protein
VIDLYTAVGTFLITHLFPAIPALRNGAINRFGRRIYFSIFSIISVAVTVWVFIAYLNAPYVEVWSYHPWSRWAVLITMPFACILVVAGLSSPNPFSLSLNTKSFDPTRPGITALVRHPVILGLGLWSFVHMIPNGDAASLVLFGLLTLLSASGPRTLERRRQAAMGPDAWQALNAKIHPPTKIKALAEIGGVKILAGLILYVVLLFLHGPVIGISPLNG